MKKLQALVAAFVVTGAVALIMLLIGLTAIFNTNVVQASNSPNQPTVNVSAGTSSSSDQAQIQQLQNEVAQYQQQLDQANQQIQQYQQVLTQLQRLGILRVSSDGTIRLGGGARTGGGSFGGFDDGG